MFYLHMFDEICLLSQFGDIWLWYKSLCHVNFDNLINISKMKKVRGFSRLKRPDNVVCITMSIRKNG